MARNASELLEACGVAERISERLPDGPGRDAVRAELDCLRRAVAESALRDRQPNSLSSSAVTKSVELLAAVKAPPGASTDILLARWRLAEKAVAEATPGTFAWLVACLAVESAKDEYHARTNALQVPGFGEVLRP